MQNKKMEEVRQLLRSAMERGLEFENYLRLHENLVEKRSTTGPNHSEAYINYTKLNYHRTKRVLKTSVLNPDLLESLKSSPRMNWILLTESWCGDAASSVPLIGKIVESVENINLKLILRDENLKLMDHFLTNKGRSIPKLIATDLDFNVLFSWGPRPQEAQVLYDNWKNDPNKISYEEFQPILQKWYNQDKGHSLQEELYKKLRLIDMGEVATV
jgi:hypothetical protein